MSKEEFLGKICVQEYRAALAAEELWYDEEYIEFFEMLPKTYKVLTMIDKWDEIPKEFKHEVFCNVYSTLENGFSEIPDEILEEVCSLKPELPHEVIDKVQNGVIYHGGKINSFPVNNLTSWTLSLKTAEWFANRFKGIIEGTPAIWRGKIDIRDIVAYINIKEEEEIIVKRGCVQILDYKEIT